MIHVVEISDPETLENHRLLWGKLLAQTPRASFFQSLDWLQCLWRHYGAGCRFRILVISAAGEPLGILPLYIRRQSTRLGMLRVLGYPLLDWGTFYGPVGPNPTATLIAGLNHLRRSERDWDLIELGWTGTALDRGRTRRAMSLNGFSPQIGEPRPVALVQLADSWEAYWASRTSRWRNNVRRSEKKLAQGCEVRHVRYRPAGAARGDGDPAWPLFDECLRIAEASWQGRSTTGNTLTHPEVLAFLRDAHEAAARAGSLDLNLLYVGDRAVAFNYAYHYRGYVFGLRTGYDPATGEDGAGSVLQARMIEDCFARGDRLYDLGADYLDCKRYWLNQTEQTMTYTCYSPDSARAQLLRGKRWLSGWLGTRRSA